MRSVETSAERRARLVVSYALQPQRCAAPKFVQQLATVQERSQRCVRFTACLEDLVPLRWHIQLAARLSDSTEAVFIHVPTFAKGPSPILYWFYRRD